MKTEKGQFIYQLSEDVIIDLGSIDDRTWSDIKRNVKTIMAAKQTDEIGMAYIAAFIIYLSELDALSKPYDKDTDLFN